MVLATACVVGLPMVCVWVLRRVGILSSLWVCLVVSVMVTLAVAVTGSAGWKRRVKSGDILWSELLAWGWLRRRRIARQLRDARQLLGDGATSPAARRATLRRLAAALDAEDPYLHGHSRRVARYATLTARRLGLSPRAVETIADAAVLHDIGKLDIDRAVLDKPGRLNPEEWQAMRGHPVSGADMIADPAVAAMVRHHHCRYDGTGYPDGLTGEAIPLGSRIIAVADAFDAIVSARPYRGPSPHRRGLLILQADSATHFDPTVVAAFLAAYEDRRSGVLLTSLSELVAHSRISASSAAGYLLAALSAALVAIALTPVPSYPARGSAPEGVVIGTGNPHPGGLPRGSM